MLKIIFWFLAILPCVLLVCTAVSQWLKEKDLFQTENYKVLPEKHDESKTFKWVGRFLSIENERARKFDFSQVKVINSKAVPSVMGERDWRPFIYGGLASCTAEFGTFPIDTTKTRLQVQGQTVNGRVGQLKYDGMVDAFLKISRQEGIAALYCGICPAVLRQATYGTIKFGIYYTLKSMLEQREAGAGDVRVNVCCAVVAGMVSSAIANPTDVLKVRMQVLGAGRGASLVSCFSDVYRHEGIQGLWRGVGPTAQRAAVIAAVELPVYDFCKHQLLSVFGDRITNHFVSSFIASLGSAVASTPIDVIRTRLMNDRKLTKTLASSSANGHTLVVRNYSGSMDCLLQTVKNEGPLALYRGFVPTWVRMGPWNIIFFITYEQLKAFY